MFLTRRDLLGGVSSTAAASLALGVASACSTRPEAKSIGKVALLSPVTGERAQIGAAIGRAVGLVDAKALQVRVFDTRGTAEGAREAARKAVSFGAGMIIGPASADEARAVAASVPVVTFSNDETLQASGMFVLGVTAAQSAGAVLAYARAAGVRTVAVMGPATDWRSRCESAARAQAASGLQVVAAMDVPPGSVVEALRGATGGELPNAVLLPEGGPDLARVAGELAAASIQVLGTSQWSAADMATPAALGAWIAAPDPRASARFVETYTQAHGAGPGIIGGLAYDAMFAATTLARAGRMTRAGLLQAEGFSGVTGLFRFVAGQKAERKLSILVASPHR